MDASSDAESDAESTRTPPRASDRHCGVVRLSHRCLNSIRQLVLHVFVCLRFCATPRGVDCRRDVWKHREGSGNDGECESWLY
jgi:hypothetical protein